MYVFISLEQARQSREHPQPGLLDAAWSSNLRVELHVHDGKTRLVVREGPHPPGTADLGRQAWDMMLSKLETLLSG